MRRVGNIKVFWFVLIMVLGFLAPASFVLALEITYPTLPGGISLGENPQLNEYVRYLYAFSIFVSGFVALGVLIFGGVMRLLSGNNVGRAANAREWIAAGFWGILILLMSYIILATINPQLVGLKEVEFEPTQAPPYVPTAKTPLPEQKDVGFQIPMGKLIEKAILEGQEKFSIDGEEFKNDAEFRPKIKGVIQEIVSSMEDLNPKLSELKELIDQCNCGGSICAGDCSPQGCNANCDFDAIASKANQIKNSPVLTALEEKEKKMTKHRNEVEKRNLGPYKGVFLATIFFDDVLDYSSFVIEREETENIFKRKVEIETLPEWEDIKITIKTNDGRVIADPATLYFWKKYQEMEDAINFASGGLGGDFKMSCHGTNMPSGTICVPSQPGKMVWPAEGNVTTRFGEPGPWRLGYHAGIDIANSLGTPIVAAADGVVINVNTECTPGNIECGGKYGNFILIEHKDFDPHIGTIYTLYAHLDSVSVSSGASVVQGQQIGTMGWTGWVEPLSEQGTHLHFEVRQDAAGNNPIDPMTYLTGESICGAGGAGEGGKCEVVNDPNSPCYVEKLRQYFEDQAEEASQICNKEGARPFTYINDACKTGGADYSVGPFQINLYRTCRCPGAWVDANNPNWCEDEMALDTYTCPWPPYNKTALDQCAEDYGYGNPDLHYEKAAKIFNDWDNWCAWSTACPLYCNLCSNWGSCP